MVEEGAHEALWLRLGASLGAQMGLHFPRERQAELQRAIAAAAPVFGLHSPEACARWLLSAPLTRRQIEILAERLTIGETYFFRDRSTFEVLERRIFPPILRARAAGERRLRIWSAGCCTGEEPYSLAMLLATLIPDLRAWNISILATDIDPAFLRKASAGVYGKWSFRDTPHGIKERFFTRTREGRYAVAPEIKALVSFAYLNLAQDPYPSLESGTNAMDLIFCRNVLMYFEPAHARRVVQNLGRSLLDEGWLLVGPAEIPQVALPSLVPVNFPGVIAHRKAAEVRPTPPRQPPASRPASPPIPPVGTVRRAARPAPTLAPLPVSARTPPTAHEQAASMAERARASANQGLLADAAEWCAKAAAIDKLNAQWRYLHAVILQEQGLADEAAAALRRALYLDQDHALAHFALGNLRRRSGLRDEARRHYRNALSALTRYRPEDVLPESEDITAGRLAEAIRAIASAESAA